VEIEKIEDGQSRVVLLPRSPQMQMTHRPGFMLLASMPESDREIRICLFPNKRINDPLADEQHHSAYLDF